MISFSESVSAFSSSAGDLFSTRASPKAISVSESSANDLVLHKGFAEGLSVLQLLSQ